MRQSEIAMGWDKMKCCMDNAGYS